MSTLTDLFTNIAAAIRSKTGGAGTIVASNFPSAISGIVTLAGGSADATAAATEILSPKTAYVQGVKVTGSMPTLTSWPGTAYPKDVNGNFGMLTGIAGYYPKDAIVYANAAACGITPEKILQGQSILGVAGSYVPASRGAATLSFSDRGENGCVLSTEAGCTTYATAAGVTVNLAVPSVFTVRCARSGNISTGITVLQTVTVGDYDHVYICRMDTAGAHSFSIASA